MKKSSFAMKSMLAFIAFAIVGFAGATKSRRCINFPRVHPRRPRFYPLLGRVSVFIPMTMSPMNLLQRTFAAALSFAAFAASAHAESKTPPAGAPWTKDFLEAHRMASEQGKPIFIYSTKTHCPHCIVMEKGSALRSQARGVL